MISYASILAISLAARCLAVRMDQGMALCAGQTSSEYSLVRALNLLFFSGGHPTWTQLPLASERIRVCASCISLRSSFLHANRCRGVYHHVI